MLIEPISFLEQGKATNSLEQLNKLDNVVSGKSFDSLIVSNVDNLNNVVSTADKLTSDYALGVADIQDVMLAVEEANITMQLAVTVRNKLVEGLQELLRMQL